MAVVGPSVPARRPFFSPIEEVPALIQKASNFSREQVFQYALAGGWPSSNSALRLVTALQAVLCSFSFAFVASLASARRSRVVFSVCLTVVAVFALVTAILDATSLAKTARECSDRKCVTAVPQDVLDSGSICICSVDAWYYFTLAADIVLLFTAVTCLVLTVVPMVKRRGIDPR